MNALRTVIPFFATSLLVAAAEGNSPARPSDCLQFSLPSVPYDSPLLSQITSRAIEEFEKDGWLCGKAKYADCYRSLDTADRVEALFLYDACHTYSSATFAITYTIYPASKYDDEIYIDLDTPRVAKARFLQLEEA